jgi:hypothetical protein
MNESSGVEVPVATPSSTLEFLRWLADRSRTYAETMEAWQTSCPRFSVWEDSLIDGLIRLEPRMPVGESLVLLTERGSFILDGSA